MRQHAQRKKLSPQALTKGNRTTIHLMLYEPVERHCQAQRFVPQTEIEMCAWAIALFPEIQRRTIFIDGEIMAKPEFWLQVCLAYVTVYAGQLAAHQILSGDVEEEDEREEYQSPAPELTQSERRVFELIHYLLARGERYITTLDLFPYYSDYVSLVEALHGLAMKGVIRREGEVVVEAFFTCKQLSLFSTVLFPQLRYAKAAWASSKSAITLLLLFAQTILESEEDGDDEHLFRLFAEKIEAVAEDYPRLFQRLQLFLDVWMNQYAIKKEDR
jgi:hypothetical protein